MTRLATVSSMACRGRRCARPAGGSRCRTPARRLRRLDDGGDEARQPPCRNCRRLHRPSPSPRATGGVCTVAIDGATCTGHDGRFSRSRGCADGPSGGSPRDSSESSSPGVLGIASATVAAVSWTGGAEPAPPAVSARRRPRLQRAGRCGRHGGDRRARRRPARGARSRRSDGDGHVAVEVILASAQADELAADGIELNTEAPGRAARRRPRPACSAGTRGRRHAGGAGRRRPRPTRGSPSCR